METTFWRLTVRSSFSAAHALRGYQGKCENLHGHNYAVEMNVDGYRLDDDIEFAVDFSILKRHLNDALEALDHKNLNELEPFTRMNATAENLARYLFKKLKIQLSGLPVELHSMTVWETEKQGATYFEAAAKPSRL